ncbi:MAG: ribonuclease PH [Planctomycetota bacterium]|nr:MAG: ribonuclease PH [Planctomycetota bacterium]
MLRHDGRSPSQLRPIRVERPFYGSAPGRVLIQAGRTTVLCTASVDEGVPPWKMRDPKPSGWVTAEYSMLPGSTAPRKGRERSGKVDGRSTEIQRLIGRSLRAVVDVEALGPRTITIDCDVLEADGGTRTLSITGGFIALVDAVQSLAPLGVDPALVIPQSIAAVSVGIFDGVPVLDLDYHEDSQAGVDFNVVMTGEGRFVEVQGTAEHGTFSHAELLLLLALAQGGLHDLQAMQKQVLGEQWPLDTNR